MTSELDTLINQLYSLISKIRTVKVGDYVLSSDHNQVVDALKLILEILTKLYDQIEKARQELETLKITIPQVKTDIQVEILPRFKINLKLAIEKYIKPEVVFLVGECPPIIIRG